MAHIFKGEGKILEIRESVYDFTSRNIMPLADTVVFKIKVTRKKSIPRVSYKGKFKVIIPLLGRFMASEVIELRMPRPFTMLSENPF